MTSDVTSERPRLNGKQCHALFLVAHRSTACAYAHATDADRGTAWVHFQTAEALERRGLITISRTDEWDIEITAAGEKLVRQWVTGR